MTNPLSGPTPKRWKNWCFVTHGHALQLDPGGNFVLFEDYDNLERLLAEAVVALEYIQSVNDSDCRYCNAPSWKHDELCPIAALARIKAAGWEADYSDEAEIEAHSAAVDADVAENGTLADWERKP